MAGLFKDLEKLKIKPKQTLPDAIVENRKRINEIIDIINKEVSRTIRY